ncbi:hypothetical protein ASE94_00070 [Devosia sp. Leaf64]|nr:hypothetical protein ASE94_00070 [Devosia sp. Leaf64]
MKLAHYQHIDSSDGLWHLVLDLEKSTTIPEHQAHIDWKLSEPCSDQLLHRYSEDLKASGFAVFKGLPLVSPGAEPVTET